MLRTAKMVAAIIVNYAGNSALPVLPIANAVF